MTTAIDDRPFARYDPESGTIEVAIVPSGLPRLTSVLPAPVMEEADRLLLIESARRSAHIDGYWVADERRVRNPAFDGRGEKSSTRFVVRPCQNDAEARATVALIQGHLDELAGTR